MLCSRGDDEDDFTFLSLFFLEFFFPSVCSSKKNKKLSVPFVVHQNSEQNKNYGEKYKKKFKKYFLKKNSIHFICVR